MFQHLRDTVIRYSGLLRWLIIIGSLTIVLGLGYFLGIYEIDFEYSLIGVPVNSFYGITYLSLFAFGFYLILLALLLILPTLDSNSRRKLHKYQQLFIGGLMVGLGLISYSLLIYFEILPSLESRHTYFDYFVLGLLLLISTYLFLMFSFEKFQDLYLYNRIWYILICLGIMFELFALASYWSLMRIIRISQTSWGIFYFIGVIFLFIGGAPVLNSFKYNEKINRQITLILGHISAILIISGLITYLAPTLALNGIVFPLYIFEFNRYFDYLYFGSLFLIIGLAIVFNLEGVQEYSKKYSKLWVSVLIFGLSQYIVSILMEITDTHFTDLGVEFLFQQSTTRGSLLFDMTWNVFLLNSFITTLSALMILSALIFKETLLVDLNQNSVLKELNDPE